MFLDFIPLPHTAIHEKANEELDRWGLPVTDGINAVTLRARISYNTRKEKISLVSGEELTYTAIILLEGLPDVDYTDSISWTDDFGRSHKLSPVEIDYKQDMSGNPVVVRVVL